MSLPPLTDAQIAILNSCPDGSRVLAMCRATRGAIRIVDVRSDLHVFQVEQFIPDFAGSTPTAPRGKFRTLSRHTGDPPADWDSFVEYLKVPFNAAHKSQAKLIKVIHKKHQALQDSYEKNLKALGSHNLVTK